MDESDQGSSIVWWKRQNHSCVQLRFYSLQNNSQCGSDTLFKFNSLFVKNGFVFVYNRTDIYILDGKTLIQMAHLTIPNNKVAEVKVFCDADDAYLYCVARGNLHIWAIMTELYCHSKCYLLLKCGAYN